MSIGIFIKPPATSLSAASIVVTPMGTITDVNVQSALFTLGKDKMDKITPGAQGEILKSNGSTWISGNQNATKTIFTPTGDLFSITVQDAIAEVNTKVGSIETALTAIIG